MTLFIIISTIVITTITISTIIRYNLNFDVRFYHFYRFYKYFGIYALIYLNIIFYVSSISTIGNNIENEIDAIIISVELLFHFATLLFCLAMATVGKDKYRNEIKNLYWQWRT